MYQSNDYQTPKQRTNNFISHESKTHTEYPIHIFTKSNVLSPPIATLKTELKKKNIPFEVHDNPQDLQHLLRANDEYSNNSNGGLVVIQTPRMSATDISYVFPQGFSFPKQSRDSKYKVVTYPSVLSQTNYSSAKDKNQVLSMYERHFGGNANVPSSGKTFSSSAHKIKLRNVHSSKKDIKLEGGVQTSYLRQARSANKIKSGKIKPTVFQKLALKNFGSQNSDFKALIQSLNNHPKNEYCGRLQDIQTISNSLKSSKHKFLLLIDEESIRTIENYLARNKKVQKTVELIILGKLQQPKRALMSNEVYMASDSGQEILNHLQDIGFSRIQQSNRKYQQLTTTRKNKEQLMSHSAFSNNENGGHRVGPFGTSTSIGRAPLNELNSNPEFDKEEMLRVSEKGRQSIVSNASENAARYVRNWVIDADPQSNNQQYSMYLESKQQMEGLSRNLSNISKKASKVLSHRVSRSSESDLDSMRQGPSEDSRFNSGKKIQAAGVPGTTNMTHTSQLNHRNEEPLKSDQELMSISEHSKRHLSQQSIGNNEFNNVNVAAVESTSTKKILKLTKSNKNISARQKPAPSESSLRNSQVGSSGSNVARTKYQQNPSNVIQETSDEYRGSNRESIVNMDDHFYHNISPNSGQDYIASGQNINSAAQSQSGEGFMREKKTQPPLEPEVVNNFTKKQSPWVEGGEQRKAETLYIGESSKEIIGPNNRVNNGETLPLYSPSSSQIHANEKHTSANARLIDGLTGELIGQPFSNAYASNSNHRTDNSNPTSASNRNQTNLNNIGYSSVNNHPSTSSHRPQRNQKLTIDGSTGDLDAESRRVYEQTKSTKLEPTYRNHQPGTADSVYVGDSHTNYASRESLYSTGNIQSSPAVIKANRNIEPQIVYNDQSSRHILMGNGIQSRKDVTKTQNTNQGYNQNTDSGKSINHYSSAVHSNIPNASSAVRHYNNTTTTGNAHVASTPVSQHPQYKTYSVEEYNSIHSSSQPPSDHVVFNNKVSYESIPSPSHHSPTVKRDNYTTTVHRVSSPESTHNSSKNNHPTTHYYERSPNQSTAYNTYNIQTNGTTSPNYKTVSTTNHYTTNSSNSYQPQPPTSDNYRVTLSLEDEDPFHEGKARSGMSKSGVKKGSYLDRREDGKRDPYSPYDQHGSRLLEGNSRLNENKASSRIIQNRSPSRVYSPSTNRHTTTVETERVSYNQPGVKVYTSEEYARVLDERSRSNSLGSVGHRDNRVVTSSPVREVRTKSIESPRQVIQTGTGLDLNEYEKTVNANGVTVYRKRGHSINSGGKSSIEDSPHQHNVNGYSTQGAQNSYKVSHYEHKPSNYQSANSTIPNERRNYHVSSTNSSNYQTVPREYSGSSNGIRRYEPSNRDYANSPTRVRYEQRSHFESRPQGRTVGQATYISSKNEGEIVPLRPTTDRIQPLVYNSSSPVKYSQYSSRGQTYHSPNVHVYERKQIEQPRVQASYFNSRIPQEDNQLKSDEPSKKRNRLSERSSILANPQQMGNISGISNKQSEIFELSDGSIMRRNNIKFGLNKFSNQNFKNEESYYLDEIKSKVKSKIQNHSLISAQPLIQKTLKSEKEIQKEKQTYEYIDTSVNSFHFLVDEDLTHVKEWLRRYLQTKNDHIETFRGVEEMFEAIEHQSPYQPQYDLGLVFIKSEDSVKIENRRKLNENAEKYYFVELTNMHQNDRGQSASEHKEKQLKIEEKQKSIKVSHLPLLKLALKIIIEPLLCHVILYQNGHKNGSLFNKQVNHLLDLFPESIFIKEGYDAPLNVKIIESMVDDIPFTRLYVICDEQEMANTTEQLQILGSVSQMAEIRNICKVICIPNDNRILNNQSKIQQYPNVAWMTNTSQIYDYKSLIKYALRQQIDQEQEAQHYPGSKEKIETIFYHSRHRNLEYQLEKEFPSRFQFKVFNGIHEVESHIRKTQTNRREKERTQLKKSFKNYLILHPCLSSEHLDLKLFKTIYMLGKTDHYQRKVIQVSNVLQLQELLR